MSTRTLQIYTRPGCMYCFAAKNLLSQSGIEFEEITLVGNPELTTEVMQKSGQRTVPQIRVGDHWLGGFRELQQLHSSGELGRVLATSEEE